MSVYIQRKVASSDETKNFEYVALIIDIHFGEMPTYMFKRN